MINHLEQLIAEWYEFNGYFVKRNILVSPRSNGGYDTELDIVAFHPQKKDVYHIETSLDTYSWAKREERFKKKFDIGRLEIPKILDGLDTSKTIHQEAVLLFASKNSSNGQTRELIGGGKLKLVEEYLDLIYDKMQSLKLNNAMVSEQFYLLRTIQFVANLKK